MTRLQLKYVPLTIALTLLAISGAFAQQQSKPPAVDPPTEDKSDDFTAQLDKFAKRKVSAQKYTLEYKFKKGDVIRWRHDHRIVNDTKFGTESAKTSTRAQPEYSWTVKNVDSRGNMRFEIAMEKIKVWEQNGEADQIQYDSEKDKKASETCLIYQERVGRPTSMYSISPSGQIVAVKSNYERISLGGVGDNPVIAFPAMPISVGHKWDVSNVVTRNDEYGARQQLKLRVRYVLEKVVDGKAHITFDTDVLTPLNSETVRAQIVTHMSRGFVVFDITKGVLTNRETRWDERVIGYQGPESYMHYTAARKEVLFEEEKVALKATPVAKVAKKEPVDEPQQTHTLLQPLKK